MLVGGPLSIVRLGGCLNCTNDFKITFPVNPLRRHSRGKRGLALQLNPNLPSEEQLDYELEHDTSYDRAMVGAKKGKIKLERQQDIAFRMNAYRDSGRRRTMSKGEAAFRLRGGELVRHTRNLSNREKFSIANKNRVHRGKVKKSAVSEDWEHPVIILDAEHFTDLVRRWNRFNELPDVSVDSVQRAASLYKGKVNGKLVRRLIAAMLLRSGIERNPGPPGFPRALMIVLMLACGYALMNLSQLNVRVRAIDIVVFVLLGVFFLIPLVRILVLLVSCIIRVLWSIFMMLLKFLMMCFVVYLVILLALNPGLLLMGLMLVWSRLQRLYQLFLVLCPFHLVRHCQQLFRLMLLQIPQTYHLVMIVVVKFQKFIYLI